ncbi:MAG: DNA alkylation repair protein [Planctomycetota bacterium]|nr:DNA alkylation repair protein [Planctomycetota bacterium]
MLRDLNAGRIETRSLVEWLAIDFALLARSALPTILPASAVERVAEQLEAHRALGIVARTQIAGHGLAAALGSGAARERRLRALATHPSDTLRGWAAYAATTGEGPLSARLTTIRPFAADAHSGVRELAWMAVRPAIAAEIERALDLLSRWSGDPDANVRRFASESTRPRGVWCAHVAALKADPSPGLAVLEPLRADPSKYVRDSVANWLNDASKDDPAWVRAVCARWSRESRGPETAYVVKRAQRTLLRTE